ncbi:hypothetical protein IAD21_05520 [Abditibacteriota bacterium]|nr:hypothetical protein IAD21_05520 [Abditibacteriota bacterium]
MSNDNFNSLESTPSDVPSDLTSQDAEHDHFGCLYPDKCIVSGPHFSIECCTAEQAALINADLAARMDAGLDPVSSPSYGLHETTWIEEMAKQVAEMEAEAEVKSSVSQGSAGNVESVKPGEDAPDVP